VLFLHVTSHVEGDKDQDLLSEKGGRGFPTLLFLDADGEIAAQVADRSVEGFLATGKALKTVSALENKERSGPEDVEFFLARIVLGKLDLAAATKIADQLPATGADAERVAEALLELEITGKLENIRSREEAEAAGEAFAAMVAAGRTPQKAGIPTARFWLSVSQHAEKQKDAALFQKCIDGVKAALGEKKEYERLYTTLAEKLAGLQG
jgi:hypothetical protein